MRHGDAPLPVWLKQALGPSARPAYTLAHVASALGMRLFLVGGAVRDWLKPPSGDVLRRDCDLVVVGDARRLGEHARLRMGGHLRTSDRFLTAHFRPAPGVAIDLATARSETYAKPGALPSVTPADIEADLWRRDFSCNALAVEILPNETAAPAIIDPTGGLADLSQGQLRISHPLSFQDDATRIYRAARLMGRLGLTLSSASADSLAAAVAAGWLKTLTQERLGQELACLWEEPDPTKGLMLLLTWKALPFSVYDGDEAFCKLIQASFHVQGELFASVSEAPTWGQIIWVFISLTQVEPDRRRLARLVSSTPGSLSLWLEGPEQLLEAQRIIDKGDVGQSARLLRGMHPALKVVMATIARYASPADPACSRHRNEIIYWFETEGRKMQTVVTSAALIDRGVKPGPRLGRALLAAQLEAWREGSGDAQWHAAVSAGVDETEVL